MKEGYVKLKRYYEENAAPEDYYDLTEYDIYFDSIAADYKVKILCAECKSVIGWYCYKPDEFYYLWADIADEGVVCNDCYECDPYQYTEGGICGKLCSC